MEAMNQETTTTTTIPNEGNKNRKGKKGPILAIIGCGPTAFGAAYNLHKLKQQISMENASDKKREDDLNQIEVIILERDGVPGGLARSVTDQMGFTYDFGIHIGGASRFSCFLEAVDSTVEQWNRIRRHVLADLSHVFSEEPSFSRDRQRHYIPYPVQQSVAFFPHTLRSDCINELKAEENRKNAGQECQKIRNFEDYSERMFGKTLQKIFIRPYNEKVWTVKLDEMSTSWVEGRVAKVDIESLIAKSQLSRKQLLDIERQKPVACFRYPAKCKGIGECWQKMMDRMPKHWFHLNQEVVQIDPAKKQLTCIDTETEQRSTFNYDYLLSTIPIPELGRMTGLTRNPVSLKHSQVILVGLGLRRPQPEWLEDVSWIYFSSADTVFYRCTFLSNFNDYLTPDNDRYWSVLCEASAKMDQKIDLPKYVDQTIIDLERAEVINDRAQVCSRWSHFLPYGYPIPTLDRDEELARLHAIFEKNHIYSRGRFGGWKYEMANQDHSFAMGYQLVDRLFNGIAETLYKTDLS